MNPITTIFTSRKSVAGKCFRTAAMVCILMTTECASRNQGSSALPVSPNADVPNPPLPYSTWPFSAPKTDAPADFQMISKIAETDGIQVRAAMSLNNSLAKPVILKLTLQNHRNEDAFFDSHDYGFQLFDEAGQSVAMTELGRRLLGNLCVQNMNGGWKLSAGNAVSDTYDLRDYFLVTCEGAYRLTVIRTVCGTRSYPQAGDDLQVEIDSIVFNLQK